MSQLQIILMFVLQFEGIRGQFVSVFHRPGQEAILPCDVLSTYSSSCSRITWLYQNRQQRTMIVAEKGNVRTDLDKAARLRLKSRCSLFISNITAEDAGHYVCRLDRDAPRDQNVYLNVMTISPLPPGPEPKSSGDVTFNCSLLFYSPSISCGMKSIRWLDEEGTVLAGENVVHRVTREECSSYLTVNRHQNRRFICQFVDQNNAVKIEGDVTLVFTGHLYIVIGVVVTLVLLLVVVSVVVLIQYRKRTKLKDGLQKPIHLPEETETNVTYITVSHVAQRAPPVKKAKEEESVTYSTVKTLVEAEVDDPYTVISPKENDRDIL